MPNRVHREDPFLATLRRAVQAKMKASGHRQKDLVKATGASQSLVSRFMSGERKHWSPKLRPLCIYADLEPIAHKESPQAGQALSQLLREAIGDNPAAEQALIRIVEALAPVLQQIPRPGAPSKGTRS